MILDAGDDYVILSPHGQDTFPGFARPGLVLAGLMLLIRELGTWRRGSEGCLT